tara:strand:- start:21 stop:407 length:387 start_codon:yes stop_codon:yes gene_type:complete
MTIEHLAIWSKDIEKMKAFYLEFFEVNANEKYFNPIKNFSSYFLSFPSGAQIELMHSPKISRQMEGLKQNLGLAHFAIALGNKQIVDDLTHTLRVKRYSILGEPRTTCNGHYESVIADPEGNQIELTI